MNYNSDERALIWLNNYPISVYKKNQLIEQFMSPSEMLEEIAECKDIYLPIVGIDVYNQMLAESDNSFIDKIIYAYDAKNIKILTLFSDDYPNDLSNIQDPPIVLYCRGNIDLLDTPKIAVVGTRRLTRYGTDVTTKFTKELTYNKFTIVSGLARGVDSVAHRVCLENEGNTIAVLGCGIDIIYPKENRDLTLAILEKGLIISEFPLGTSPQPFNFPQRNRIISGLSDGVLITEAGIKSGSMITANLAIDQGKELFIVPGSIFSEASSGTNDMIKKFQDKVIVTNINDILERFNMVSRDIAPTAIQLDFVQVAIIKELELGDLHFEEILQKTKLDVSSLMSCLTGLEVVGVIRKLPGNFYQIVGK